MRLRAIKNHIIFQFIDEVDTKGRFVEKTKWGLEIPGHFDNSAKSPRWANVTEVGPDVENVKVGQQVLINALKWTEGVKLEGVRFWRTDETQVAAVRKSPTGDIRALRDTIIFHRLDTAITKTKSGLEVVGDVSVESPHGMVVLLGPDCEPELKGATIYFSDANFFNKFEHDGERYWYLTEPEVLVYDPA